jgi:hypothetical protein
MSRVFRSSGGRRHQDGETKQRDDEQNRPEPLLSLHRRSLIHQHALI